MIMERLFLKELLTCRSIHTKITKAIKQARFLSFSWFMTKVVVLEKFKKIEIGSVVSVKMDMQETT